MSSLQIEDSVSGIPDAPEELLQRLRRHGNVCMGTVHAFEDGLSLGARIQVQLAQGRPCRGFGAKGQTIFESVYRPHAFVTMPPQSLKQLRWSIRDSRHRILDLKGTHCSWTLTFDQRD